MSGCLDGRHVCKRGSTSKVEKVGQVGQGLDSWGCPRRILTGNNSKVKAVCQARLLMNDAGSTLTKLNGYKFHTFLLAGPTGGAKFSTGRITMWSFLGVFCREV